MHHLIGFGMIILGGILTGVTGFPVFSVIILIGVLLFASFLEEDLFLDYVIANSNVALIRKRYYIASLPLTLVSYIVTLRKGQLKIIWKEEYYKATMTSDNNVEPLRISRKEYITLRNEQRIVYSTQPISKEFMEKTYSVEDIGFKRKKTRLILACVFAGLMLLGITDPGDFYISLIYEAIFLPMVILWIPDYKDAKILQQAYDRAVGAAVQPK